MPNSKQHSDKAAHNKRFLTTITTADFPDWAAVVAFYTAVHLVERLRTREQNQTDQHSTDHQNRNEFIQKRHRNIHAAFHALYNASLIARYQTLEKFRRTFTVKAVQDSLIATYLESVQKYVDTQFGTNAAPSS
jgi:hypothetical protein